MDDPNIPGGLSGLIGVAGAAIIWGALKLRNLFSKDSVDRSADSAYRAMIESQAAELVIERKRNSELRDSLDAALVSRDDALSIERGRTEAMRVSLDAAVAQISALNRKVADMSGQLDKLQRLLASTGYKP